MKFLRAVLRGLDPWAALLLGILVTLAVVILLAMPGPWQKVVGLQPPAARVLPPPQDIGVFVQGGTNKRCTGIVWLHVDHKRVSLTATVVAPQTQARVAGGGYVQLRHIVDDLGPQVAAEGLGDVLGVDLDAWVTLDRDAMRLAVPTMFSGGRERPRLSLYMAAARAWQGQGGLDELWPTQYETLSTALPQLAFDQLNVVAFANYVLGFGIMQNELDLQAATTVATTLRSVRPAHVRVRACPAAVDVCHRGQAWSLQDVSLARLRHAVAVGLRPPESLPVVVIESRSARVLVLAPDDRVALGAYTRELQRFLRRSAGVEVAVRSLSASPDVPMARVRTAITSWRPLAVLIAPAGGAEESMTAVIGRLGALLTQLEQPAVVSTGIQALGPPGPAWEELDQAIADTGLPVSALPAGTLKRSPFSPATARAAARANAQSLVRATWQETLSPRLASTRLGFGFAAAAAVPEVRVVSTSGARAIREAARLRLWGYHAEVMQADSWPQEQPTPGVYHQAGFRRAAQALAGDLGLRRSRVVADATAPADLVLVLSK